MAYLSDIECGKCGGCEEVSNLKIYCGEYGAYYYIDNKYNEERRGELCRKFWNGTPKLNSNSSGSGCYITTMVCNILGFDDKCPTLEVLRSFRRLMQKDPKYTETLYEYDTVGPKIANRLEKDPSKKEIAQGFYNAYIDPTARLIAAQRYDQAVEKYKKMTNILREYYGIQKVTDVPKAYNYTEGGHGYVKKIGENPSI